MPEIPPQSFSGRCGGRRSRRDRIDAHPSPHPTDDPAACPDCEAIAGLRMIELDLRWLSLDLWVAGWSPDEVIDRLRSGIPDPRAVDLFTRGVLADDRLRSEQARPPDWCAAIDRLRAATGIGRDAEPFGWLPGWVRERSDYESSEELAMVIGDTLHILVGLHDPPLAA